MQDIPDDAYRQAQGAIKNPLTIPDINDRTQTIAVGFIDEIGLKPGEGLPGYQVSKPYVGRGSSGAASRTTSKPIVDYIIREFQQNNPRSGAVFSSSRGKQKELLRAGTEKPGEKFVRERYNEIIKEINRRNGAQSPYGQKPDTPRQPPGVVQQQLQLQGGG